MAECRSIYELGDLRGESRELSIMTDAPFFTEKALNEDPLLRALTREQVVELIRPTVVQFRGDSEDGRYEYSSYFPRGVCGEAREYLLPLLEAEGFFVVCRVFETHTPGFQRVATIGDLIIDPTVDADGGDVEDKVYIGPQNDRYKDITSPEQFERIALSYWDADHIIYFNHGGFFLERPYGSSSGSLLIPLPGQVPTNLFDTLKEYIIEKTTERFKKPGVT
ncbi:MAG: hypothetical protein QF824_00990 [Candidatus Woesearchaeota archaeon]|jgi:hypothetical protein|nr:hypothetical protein [Candidatus Woesearchaeota archaeon]